MSHIQPNTHLPTPIIKLWTAIANQTGTNAPIMTILHNTIGEITWTYDSTGQFTGTSEAAFPEGKTIVFTSGKGNSFIVADRATNDTISLAQVTYDGNPINNINNATIEIRVYK